MLFPDNCCQKLKKKVFYSLVWLPMECKVMFCLFLSQICCKWFILFGTNVLRPNWKFHKDSKWNHSPLHQDITWQRYPRFFTFYIGFAPPCQNEALLQKIWSHKPYLVPNSLALMPAALTAARPASLEARSTKTVPHNLMPKPKVPAYWDQ